MTDFQDLGYDFPISLNYFTSLPDITSISDPNTVVLFKSLLKKDGKTKEKALNELLSVTIDESTLTAWLQLYPKLAIDNSKSVRVLTHQAQLNFLSQLGSKNFSKYLKDFIPIWILGIYDNDKSVSNTSYKSLLQLLNNDQEKFEKLFDVFHEQILNLIGNVVCVESPDTLSDKRYTNEDDIIMKYDRVLTSCINMLIKVYTPTELSYEVISSDTLWNHLSTSLKQETLNLNLFKSLLNLISVIPKDEIKLFKKVTKKFFKIKFKNQQNIIFSSVMIPFWNTVLLITKYKPTLWEEKENKFYEFLKVGPCNSNPIYYDVIVELLEIFKKEGVLEFKQDEYNFLFNLFADQFKSLQGEFKTGALRCLIVINKLFNHDFDDLMLLVLNNKRNTNQVDEIIEDNFTNEISDSLTKISHEIHDTAVTQALIRVLLRVKMDGTVDNIVSEAISSADEDKLRSFQILTACSNNPNSELVEFFKEIPSFVENDFVKGPIDILKIAVEGNHVEDETINDFYLKLSMVAPDKINSFLKSIKIDVEKERYPEIYEYLLKESQNPTDLDLLCSTKDKAIIDNVAKNSDPKEFINLVNIYGLLSLLDNNEEVLHDAWVNRDEKLLKHLRSDEEKYLKSLMKYLESRTIEDEIDYSFIEQGPLPIEQLVERVKRGVCRIDIHKVAISNPIDTSVYLCHANDEIKADPLMPVIGKLFNNLVNLPKEWKLLSQVVKEYLNDYVFTQEVDEIDEVMEISESITTHSISWADLNFDDYPIDNDLYSFYLARVLKKMIENSLECENINTFESKSINYVKLVKTPLKFYSVICGISKFANSKTLDRIENYVFSEILSVKKETANSDGLKWITLSLPFFNKSKLSTPIHKINLILNTLKSWLPTKIVDPFDPSSELTVQITRFVTLLNTLDDKPDLEDIVDSLISTNFFFGDLDQLYYTLKLYNSTNQSSSTLMSWILTSGYTAHYTPVNQLVEKTLQTALVKNPVDIDKMEWLSIFSDCYSETIQRVCVWYLEKIILKEQQDLVVEYQLSKDMEIHIPEILLDLLSSKYQSQYFLSWYLVFIYVKDITFSMRNVYIKQVENELPVLYDTLFHFIDKQNQVSYDVLQDESMEDLAVYLYYQSVLFSSSHVQSWFKQIRDKQTKSKIEKYTIKNISPILIENIMDQVATQKQKIQQQEENMTIKINLNEIKTTYIIDEQKMEMVIKIPANYPLENVVVDGPLRLGVKENQWRAWLLASQKIISLTNGSIIESIELFCKNVNLHFSGFEDCAICYSILHQDLSLPSKTCSTCSNKFHAACLYKWFKSSGSSTCPLCRSPFNFKK